MKPTLLSLVLLLIHTAVSAQQIKTTSYATSDQPTTKRTLQDSLPHCTAEDSCRGIYRQMQSRPLRRKPATTINPPAGENSYYLKSGTLYSEDN